MDFTIEAANLENPAQAKALVEIIDSYSRGPGGQSAPLSDRARSTLGRGLAEHPSATVLLAFVESDPVGTAVCLWGFSTFAGMPSVNIHDLAVLPAFQRRGIGRALIAEVERRARERGCCKITLEVHDTNEGAKGLYQSLGFGPWDPPTLFVAKPL